MDAVASPPLDESQYSPQLSAEDQDKLGLHLSHDITIADHADAEPSQLRKPPLLKHVSSPAYSSPLRHHRRTTSSRQAVKESLDAHSEYFTSQDDGAAIHRINQYVIKQEIGRGSFGAVHLAVDQYNKEYAVKEFSKARLRKRAQSHVLRKPLAHRRRGGLEGFNSPLHRRFDGSSPTDIGKESAINLIKEEIAIMKKLNHTNLVSLIEVLDDPSEDSLYMVMEMCKKGVVMKVDLEHEADPYSEEQCRCWFRDLILGIEYLHAQGVVHRDIKPDNCLITDDDILKVVDFGVSEMFEKDSEMKTAKSAGSPAFLPPELCVARHGDVSGKAADVWSMGVTLYCLMFGQIPFRNAQILELYHSIQTDEPDLSKVTDPDFRDLMVRILEKNPADRITLRELREHPWVTKHGADPLLSEEENTANMVEPPTEEEMAAAITGNMRSLMTVVKAVNKFKALTANKRPPQMASILGDRSEARFTQPPGVLPKDLPLPHLEHRSQSVTTDNRTRLETILVAEGVHRHPDPQHNLDDEQASQNLLQPTASRVKAVSDPHPVPAAIATQSEEALLSVTEDQEHVLEQDQKLPAFRSNRPHAYTTDEGGHRGHAHDPLEDTLYLYIGPSTFSGHSTNQPQHDGFMPDDGDDGPVVSESPGAADMDIYETAYRDEIERILAKAQEEEKEPHVYLTRRVDAKLMALSGLAGKWMAAGEEAKNQFKDHAQFSARKARVTEVSRALREAAMQEYEKRKQERKSMYDAIRAERSRNFESSTGPAGPPPTDPRHNPTGSAAPGTEELLQSLRESLKDKAADRGRQARTSLMGFVDMVKNKNRS